MLTTRPSGAPISPDAKRFARVNRQELHCSMTAGILDVLESGVEVSVLDGIRDWSSTALDLGAQDQGLRTRRTRLEKLIEEAGARASRARKRSLDEADEDAAAELMKGMREELGLKAKFEAELDALEQPAATPIELERELAVPLDALARALAPLSQYTANALPRDVVMAFRSLLKDFSLARDGDWVIWETKILLPATDGRVLEIGPISGKIRHRPTRRPTTRDVMHAPGLAHHDPQRLLREQLQNAGATPELAKILVRHPIPEVTAAVKHELGLGGATGCVSTDLSFLTHLVSSYTDQDSQWSTMRVHSASWVTQHLADRVKAADGEPVTVQKLEEGRPKWLEIIRRNAGDQPAYCDGFMPILVMSAVQTDGPVRHRERTVTLNRCPHCPGWIDTSVRLPEVPFGVLCSSCRRAPVPDSPVFPEAYFKLRMPVPEPKPPVAKDAQLEVRVDARGMRWHRLPEKPDSQLGTVPAYLEILVHLRSSAELGGLTGEEVARGIGRHRWRTTEKLRLAFEDGLLERSHQWPYRWKVRSSDGPAT